MQKRYVSLGLMSGTSGDGVDASIIKTNGINEFEIILDKYFEYDSDLYKDIHNIKDKIHKIEDLKIHKSEIDNLEKLSLNWIKSQKILNEDNKIKFLKTHHALCKYQNSFFTNGEVSLGTIHIVRDPRNLITSMTHHYSLSYEDAFIKLINEKQTLLEKSTDGDYSNFTFLGSWSKHYKSWKMSKNFKTLFLKYEDLEKDCYSTSLKIIEFFFCDLINELSVLKFHNSVPSLLDTALITLSKSIVKNLSLYTLISELKDDELYFDQTTLPSFKSIEYIFDKLSFTIKFLPA